jgi:hypothetical protein
MCAYNLSTWGTETGGLGVGDWPWLCCKFKARLDYIEKWCLKKKKERKKEERRKEVTAEGSEGRYYL